jgi:hypothetical protein
MTANLMTVTGWSKRVGMQFWFLDGKDWGHSKLFLIKIFHSILNNTFTVADMKMVDGTSSSSARDTW